MPISAVAIRRTSPTSQSAPTPRQSHWNRPVAPASRAVSSCGVSCWFLPSVSRMACRWVAEGTVSNTAAASSSQVPMAVPPSAAKVPIAARAAARVCGSIRAIASSRVALG